MKNRNNLFLLAVCLACILGTLAFENHKTNLTAGEAINAAIFDVIKAGLSIIAIYVFISFIYIIGYWSGVRSAKCPLIGIGSIITLCNIIISYHHGAGVVLSTTLLSLALFFLIAPVTENAFYNYFTAPTAQELADAQLEEV